MSKIQQQFQVRCIMNDLEGKELILSLHALVQERHPEFFQNQQEVQQRAGESADGDGPVCVRCSIHLLLV